MVKKQKERAASMLLIGLGWCLGTGAFAVEGATDLKAVYRQGQTFITWTEARGARAYRILCDSRKITRANVSRAETMATLPPNSGAYQHEIQRKILEKKTKTPGYNQRYMIEDGGKPLPGGVGLCVVTVREDATSYYAVETRFGAGNKTTLTRLNTPVSEKKAVPGAVRVWQNPEGTSFVYTHWMDPREWNPKYQGGYAYNFCVTVTSGDDGKSSLPVIFRLHGMGGDYRIPDASNKYWKGVNVHPGDKAGSWFYGFVAPDGKTVVNYTERRILRIVRWLKAGYPNLPFKVDPERFYLSGHSMGGTGSHALAARYGDVFAAALASKGAVNHRRNGKWTRQFARLIGQVGQNLPTVDGPGVWDWQDYGGWHLDHVGTETAFITHANGTRDGSIPWSQMPGYFDALQKAKRPFTARWKPTGHSGGYFGSCKNVGMNRFHIRLHESLPAFANASNSDDPRKTPKGQINEKLEWSSSMHDFTAGQSGDDIVDEPKRYALSVRAIGGPATVDITPRRCQKFKPRSGEEVLWRTLDHSNPRSPRQIAAGAVRADKYGLVTVARVKVMNTGWGTRLLLERK